MIYSREDIAKEYRTAKDKRRQVQVLAELNACGKDEIVRILKEMGETVDARWGKTGKKKPAGASEKEDSMIRVSADGTREIVPDRVYGSVEPSPHNVPTLEEPSEEMPMETTMTIVHDISSAAGDCLCMVREISRLLISPGNEDSMPLPPPDCMTDELAGTRDVIWTARKELQRLALRLGT